MPELILTLPIAVTLGLVAVAALLFSTEKLQTELAGAIVLCCLLVFFYFVPVRDAAGPLNEQRLLAGFGNPALIAVVSLLVIGEGLVQTDALNAIGRFAEKLAGNRPWTTICALLVFIACLSGFINNTPLVIIFIPILQAVAGRLRLAPGSVMMPLSFATILGGMTTLIGSSTNLLVSSSLISLGRPGLGLFEVSPVGVPVAAAGLLYIFFFARRLLGGGTLLTEVTAGEGKQFIAQLTISPQSKLIGQTTVAGMLRGLTDVVIKVLERDGQFYTPPLIEDMPIAAGDILVVAASRRSLSEALARNPGLTVGEVPGQNGQGRSGPQVMVEAMVVPTSPMIGHSLEQLEFTHHTQCAVIGLRRRAQLIRQRMTEIKLQAGDVLLVQGTESAVRTLRQRHEIVVLEGTAADLREPHHGTRAVLIFAAVIVLAAGGILPIVLAAILGAALMVLSGTLSLRQASRAVSRRIVMLVGSSLALGEAMEATGAAAYLSQTILDAFHGASPGVLLAVFFGVISVVTNVLSNNACAVLFTPIAVSLADRLGVDPHIFAVAVLVAADCSFASPIGYQTNLLVMGPGRYTFVDYLRFGGPLSVLTWLVFAVAAPWWFGLRF